MGAPSPSSSGSSSSIAASAVPEAKLWPQNQHRPSTVPFPRGVTSESTACGSVTNVCPGACISWAIERSSSSLSSRRLKRPNPLPDAQALLALGTRAVREGVGRRARDVDEHRHDPAGAEPRVQLDLLAAHRAGLRLRCRSGRKHRRGNEDRRRSPSSQEPHRAGTLSIFGRSRQTFSLSACATYPDRISRLPVKKTYKLYIGGAFPRSESGRTYDAQGQNVARASRKDARDAVVAARAAQPNWAAATAYNRGQVLYRVAEMLEARATEFAELTSGRDEVERAIDRWVWYAGFADKLAQVLGSSNPVA